MNKNINFRSFKEGDYETCCEWWKWWWGRFNAEPIRRAFLPKDERCFVIEKNNIPVAATFLFLTEVPAVVWTTYLVSNPKYKEKDRRDLIYLLIQGVEKKAEEYGALQIFTVCNDTHVSDIHKKLGWDMSPSKHEAFKYIENNLRKIDNNYGKKRKK
tara:strand:+ start:2036 stop:2506 length:471 start_codon:yes stop_codon:yes gene_type:complete